MSRGRRTGSEPFVMIEKRILSTTAWKELKGSRIKVYLFLRSRTCGPLSAVINKPFKMSYSVLQTETHISRQTIRDSLLDLENIGFIDLDRQGGISMGGLNCNVWTISDRFLSYGTPDFKPGKMKKHHGNFKRGFSLVKNKA